MVRLAATAMPAPKVTDASATVVHPERRAAVLHPMSAMGPGAVRTTASAKIRKSPTAPRAPTAAAAAVACAGCRTAGQREAVVGRRVRAARPVARAVAAAELAAARVAEARRARPSAATVRAAAVTGAARRRTA